MSEERGEKLFVVSAPSGAGKSTLTQAVAQKHPEIRLSISCTTRMRRGDEQDGREYYFLSEEEFSDRVNRGDFLEWAQVHGNRYGTSREFVNRLLQDGLKVLFDIDVQGADKLKQVYPDATLIFIAPPSRAELNRRLRERKTDDPAEIARRLNNALGEIVLARRYDFVVINDDLATATAELESILLGRPSVKADRDAVLDQLLREFKDAAATD